MNYSFNDSISRLLNKYNDSYWSKSDSSSSLNDEDRKEKLQRALSVLHMQINLLGGGNTTLNPTFGHVSSPNEFYCDPSPIMSNPSYEKSHLLDGDEFSKGLDKMTGLVLIRRFIEKFTNGNRYIFIQTVFSQLIDKGSPNNKVRENIKTLNGESYTCQVMVAYLCKLMQEKICKDWPGFESCINSAVSITKKQSDSALSKAVCELGHGIDNYGNRVPTRFAKAFVHLWCDWKNNGTAGCGPFPPKWFQTFNDKIDESQGDGESDLVKDSFLKGIISAFVWLFEQLEKPQFSGKGEGESSDSSKGSGEGDSSDSSKGSDSKGSKDSDSEDSDSEDSEDSDSKDSDSKDSDSEDSDSKDSKDSKESEQEKSVQDILNDFLNRPEIKNIKNNGVMKLDQAEAQEWDKNRIENKFKQPILTVKSEKGYQISASYENVCVGEKIKEVEAIEMSPEEYRTGLKKLDTLSINWTTIDKNLRCRQEDVLNYYDKWYKDNRMEIEKLADNIYFPATEPATPEHGYRSGDLDITKLWELPTGLTDGKIFSKNEISSSNKVFAVLLDMSGSMSGIKFYEATKVVSMLAEAFYAANIDGVSLSLYGHTDLQTRNGVCLIRIIDRKTDMLKFLGNQLEADTHRLGENYDGLAIENVLQDITFQHPSIRSEDISLTVVSDGRPNGPFYISNDFALLHTQRVIREWQDRGVKIHGIGICNAMKKERANFLYGADNNTIISDTKGSLPLLCTFLKDFTQK